MSVITNGAPSDPVCVAYLGPAGTYTHQAAYNCFGESATYIQKDSIAATFKSVPSEASYCLLPMENSIFGPVVETYDLLRNQEAGRDIFIIEQAILRVQHCLLVSRGTQLQDVRRVLSHEQALGQCSKFIKENLPDAALIKTASTAAAANAILSDTMRKDSAAICSAINASINRDLVVLYRGIQNEHTNFTRFWIMSSSACHEVPRYSTYTSDDPKHALLRLSPPLPSGFCNLTALLANLDVPVVQVDRRPSPLSVPFHNMYFLDLIESPHEKEDEDTDRWKNIVLKALKNARDMGWDGCVLGHWLDHGVNDIGAEL